MLNVAHKVLPGDSLGGECGFEVRKLVFTWTARVFLFVNWRSLLQQKLNRLMKLKTQTFVNSKPIDWTLLKSWTSATHQSGLRKEELLDSRVTMMTMLTMKTADQPGKWGARNKQKLLESDQGGKVILAKTGKLDLILDIRGESWSVLAFTKTLSSWWVTETITSRKVLITLSRSKCLK